MEGESTVTHTCVVFSRWTPYTSIVKESQGPTKPGQGAASQQGGGKEAPPCRGKSGGPCELPGSPSELDENALEQLQRYESFLRESEKQHASGDLEAPAASNNEIGKAADRLGCIDTEKEPGQEDASNSLGRIMQELRSLDPAEFLLLYSRMEARLKSAVTAAACPLPPSMAHVCPGGPLRLPSSMAHACTGGPLGPPSLMAHVCPGGPLGPPSTSEALRAPNMQETEEASSRSLCSCTRLRGDKMSACCSGHTAYRRQEEGHSENKERQGKNRRRVGGKTGAASQLSVSSSAPSTTCGASASRSSGGPQGPPKSWMAWHSEAHAAAAYDSIGNDTGRKYFLRRVLSQHYGDGLLLDSDSWTLMTIEPIAAHLALSMSAHSALQRELEGTGRVAFSFPRLSSSSSGVSSSGNREATLQFDGPRPIVAADGCCGAGGDVRQLSRHFDLVLGVDSDLLRVALCRHNCEILASRDAGCAPVFLFHKQLQQLANLRGCWSVRNLPVSEASCMQLTLAALLSHQEEDNKTFFDGISSGLWRGTGHRREIEAEATPQAGQGVTTSQPPQLSETQRDRGDFYSPPPSSPPSSSSVENKDGEGEKNENNCGGCCGRGNCLCVPFSLLPCRLCSAPALAAEALLRDKAESSKEKQQQQPVHPPSQPQDEGDVKTTECRERRRSLGDMLKTHQVLPVDWLYMSPPWGGENYEGCKDFYSTRFFPSTHGALIDLVVAAARVSPNVCLFMPRSTDLHEVFAVASLLHFPLVEVEVLYLCLRQQALRGKKGSSPSSAQLVGPVYPKAVIIYLVREVCAWVESRGVPSANVFLHAQKGPCKGWLSAAGVPKYPKKAGQGVKAAFRERESESLDFAFSELSFLNQEVSGREKKNVTVDVLASAQGGDSGVSAPLSFSHLLLAASAAMAALRTGKREVAVHHPHAVEEALQRGSLDVALAAFSALCGAEMAAALRQQTQKEPRCRPSKRLPLESPGSEEKEASMGGS